LSADALSQPPSSGGPQYLQVDREASGQRIDNFLLRHLKGVPRSHLYRVLRRGEVRVNKGRVKPEYRLRLGDEVRIPPLRLAPQGEAIAPPARAGVWIEGAILYEDERVLVIDKPAGLAVHGGSGLSHGLIELLRAARPGQTLELVHRLDRDTSGCLLVSKRRSALRELHRLLREKALEKRYLALLVGRLPQAEVTVEAALRKNLLQGGERVVRVDAVEGKAARTHFRRLRSLPGATLVEARLVTGRTHQIRVHAAHLGLPLAGDEKYGDAARNRALREVGLRRLFLHAAVLGFRTGEDGPAIQVQAPLPSELEGVLARLEGQ
jgi:23S rRNA pseudouridine955/2504/2580 synthase